MITTPAKVIDYWKHVEKADTHTVIDPWHHVVQVRNAKGLLTTEKWTFVYPCWLRVSTR